jgi:hypothetical protein
MDQATPPRVQLPTKIEFPITSINAAIEHWLTTVVFKEEITIDSVNWKADKNIFEIVINRK